MKSGGGITLTINSLDFELEAKKQNATVNTFYLEGVTYNLKSIALKFTKKYS